MLGFWNSCNNRTNNKYRHASEDSDMYQILSLVFDATVGSDTMWAQNILSPPVVLQGGHKSEADTPNQETDSFSLKLGNSKLNVFINDSLVRFPESRSRINFLIEPNSFKANCSGVEEMFQPLLTKLIDSPISEPLDISKLKSRYNYHIDLVSNKKKYPSSAIKVGTIKMTSPVFNNGLTIACIYSEIICGGECGNGSVFFLKKVNDHWEIAGRKELWVA